MDVRAVVLPGVIVRFGGCDPVVDQLGVCQLFAAINGPAAINSEPARIPFPTGLVPCVSNWVLLPVTVPHLMKNARVIQETLCFLSTGRFCAAPQEGADDHARSSRPLWVDW